MRSLVIALVVFLVLGGIFAVFLFTQPETPAVSSRRETSGPTSLPVAPSSGSTRPSESVIGEASGVWIQSFDKESGALVSEFRAARYDPPQQGTVRVEKPQALFYMKDGQVLMVSAESGDVVMPEQTRRAENLNSLEAQPPTRGVLNHVTIAMMKDAEDPDPSLTVSIPILAFDNETLRMNTVQTQIDGQDVLADRVPVAVRGRDYDFDGEGLVVRYNQRDQRLEYLEVTHGKRLVVKNPSAFGAGTSPAGPAPAGPQSERKPALTSEFVSADPTPAAAAAAAEEEQQRRERKRRRAAATRPADTGDAVAYQALFDGGVTIHEGDRQVGTADRMLATFTFIDDESATPRPAGRPRAAGAATRPAPRARSATAPAPATRPAPEPVSIDWSGKLIVTPVEMPRSGLRNASDRVIEFVGSPVKLEREGALVEAASVAVGVVGNRFIARSSEGFPVVTIKDPAGMLLRTAAVDFSGDQAILQGQSSVEWTLAGPGDGKPQTLAASWKERATLRLVDGPQGERLVDRATFAGAVDVQHPQLKLRSETLALAFAPVAGQTQPALSEADASGSVVATVTDDAGEVQAISADHLRLSTSQRPDGSLQLRQMHAEGNVVAQDATQRITADQLAVTLTPAGAAGDKAADVQVEQLTAQGKVHFVSEQNATALADMVTVRRQGAGQSVELHGNPAVLQDASSRLSGSLIRFDTTSGDASVVGAGTVSGMTRAEADAGQPATPMEVSWSQSLEYRAATNQVQLLGGVTVVSRGEEGSTDTATGDRMTLLLVDRPSTTQPSAIQPGASQPSTRAVAAMGGGAKQVRSIILEGNVEISSLLHAQNKDLLRRVHAFGPRVTVDVLPSGDLGKVAIPDGGRLLYEDRQPSATQPATPAVQGVIAVEWKQAMVYDPAASQATLDGDVVIVQQEAGRDPLRMNAERLVATLAAAQPGGPTQVERIIADQGASFTSRQIRFDAAEAIYEPGQDRVIARGTPRQPVQVYDESGATSGSFEELWWNIKDARPERLKNVTANVRQ